MHAYRFLNFAPVVQQPDDALRNGAKTINWYIPPIGKGSGGHLNLFRFMQHVGTQGFTSRVVIVEDDGEQSVAKTQAKIRSWFGIDNLEVYFIKIGRAHV